MRPHPEVLLYRPETVTAEGLRDFFAAVLATLDAHPRHVEVRVELPLGPDAIIDLADGNPVFAVGAAPVDAASLPRHAMTQPTISPSDFRRRWLAEHPVPLVFKASRAFRLRFVPTTSNRVKVSPRTFAVH